MNNFIPVKPKCSDPLKVLVLFSGGASGARYLFEHSAGRSGNFEILAGITDAPDCSGIEIFERKNIPIEIITAGGPNSGESEESEPEKNYFERLTERIGRYEPDLLLLSGFMRIVRDPLLSKFEGRIINVHPADLRLEEDGKRKYRGTDTVYRTITSGENAIRSTVHFVTNGVDEGPILVVSKPVPINRNLVNTLTKFNDNMIRDYANLVQEWMKWSCDGPAIQKALCLISIGKVGHKAGKLYIKDENTPVEAYYDMEKDTIVSE